MTAVSQSGLPYPESSDLVTEYPTVGKRLAESIQSGVVNFPVSGTGGLAPGSHVTLTATFPKAFAAGPAVLAVKAAVVSGTGLVMVSAVQGVSATSCSLVMTNVGSTAASWTSVIPVRWFAVGQLA